MIRNLIALRYTADSVGNSLSLFIEHFMLLYCLHMRKYACTRPIPIMNKWG